MEKTFIKYENVIKSKDNYYKIIDGKKYEICFVVKISFPTTLSKPNVRWAIDLTYVQNANDKR